MKDLQRLLGELGCRNVKTYIQSGNAVFHYGKSPAAVVERIQAAIEMSQGFRPEVIVLERAAFDKAIAANPFQQAETEPKSLHLTFLSAAPKRPDLATLDRLKSKNESYVLQERVFYLHAPDGIGKSKLAAGTEKALGVAGTSRNWRTVLALKAMAAES